MNILYRSGGGYPIENPVIRTIGEIEMETCEEKHVDGMKYRDYPVKSLSDSRYIQVLDNKEIGDGELVMAIDPSRRNVVMAIGIVDGELKVLDAIRCYHVKGVAKIEAEGIGMSYQKDRAYLRDYGLFEALKATDWYDSMEMRLK